MLQLLTAWARMLSCSRQPHYVMPVGAFSSTHEVWTQQGEWYIYSLSSSTDRSVLQHLTTPWQVNVKLNRTAIWSLCRSLYHYPRPDLNLWLAPLATQSLGTPTRVRGLAWFTHWPLKSNKIWVTGLTIPAACTRSTHRDGCQRNKSLTMLSVACISPYPQQAINQSHVNTSSSKGVHVRKTSTFAIGHSVFLLMPPKPSILKHTNLISTVTESRIEGDLYGSISLSLPQNLLLL